MLNQKPLGEMTPDEIAQLSPDKFKGLADSHNDELELRETARDRQIERTQEDRSQAMKELLVEAAKMPREDFEKMPLVNVLDSPITVMYGIPDPIDPSNPLNFRGPRNTPLEELADKAWGTTYMQALFLAGENQTQEGAKSQNTPVRVKMNPFRAMVKDCEGDEGRSRERTLRDERW